jgi:hypothetical protein
VINHLTFEPAFSEANVVQKQFFQALHDFTRFQQCDEWELLRVKPKLFRGLLS